MRCRNNEIIGTVVRINSGDEPGFYRKCRFRAAHEGTDEMFMIAGRRRECLSAIEKEGTALEGRERGFSGSLRIGYARTR